jgi:membrane associated rhomboid family serine protease
MTESLADLPRRSKKPARPRIAPAHLLHCPPVARSSVFASLPKFQRGCFWLFVVSLVVSALLADQPIAASLTLGRPFADSLALWQPVSAVVMYPDGGLGGLVGTLILQWFIGGDVEARWGTRRYLTFVLACAVAGYLVLGLIGLGVPAALAWPHGGTAPADVAAIVGFGVIHGRRPVQLFGALPITGRGLAGILAAVIVLAPLIREGWPGSVPLAVAAALAALLAWRWRPSADSGKVGPRSPPRSAGRRPNHLRVVKPPPKLLN